MGRSEVNDVDPLQLDTLELVLSIGTPLLVALFYVDGLVVGKILQPPVLLVGYVAAVDPSVGLAVLVGAACVVAVTAGQWSLYRGLYPDRRGLSARIPYLSAVPIVVLERLGDERRRWLEERFARWGGPVLCVSNVLPGMRCLMSVPAGLGRYPAARFLFFSAVGNAAYVLVLLAVGWGFLEAIGVLFGRT